MLSLSSSCSSWAFKNDNLLVLSVCSLASKLLLQVWHRGYKGQVKGFCMLFSLKKVLDKKEYKPSFDMVCRTFESRPLHRGWAVIIQAGVNLSYSIYWTQCGHCPRSRATQSTSIQARPKTHSSHRNNQAQKKSLTKEKTQSIQNVSVKCLKERGLSESTGRAEARSQCPALPCLCSC